MDNEVSGNGNQYDYGFRIYNPRLGRFLSVDPLTKSYPMLTPYQFAANMPIWAIDLDGLEAKISNTRFSCSQTGNKASLKIEADIHVKYKIIDVSNTNYKGLDYVLENAARKAGNVASKEGKGTFKRRIDYEGNQSNEAVSYNIETDVDLSFSMSSFSGIEDVQDNDYVILLINKPLEPTETGRVPRAHAILDGNVVTINIAEFAPKDGNFYSDKNMTDQLIHAIVHEVFHNLGLDDQYTEETDRTTKPKKGYEQNIMGSSSWKLKLFQVAEMINELFEDENVNTFNQNRGTGTSTTDTKRQVQDEIR